MHTVHEQLDRIEAQALTAVLGAKALHLGDSRFQPIRRRDAIRAFVAQRQFTGLFESGHERVDAIAPLLRAGVIQRGDAGGAERFQHRAHAGFVRLAIDLEDLVDELPPGALFQPAGQASVAVAMVDGHRKRRVGRRLVEPQPFERHRIQPETVPGIAADPDRPLGKQPVEITPVRAAGAIDESDDRPATDAQPVAVTCVVRQRGKLLQEAGPIVACDRHIVAQHVDLSGMCVRIDDPGNDEATAEIDALRTVGSQCVRLTIGPDADELAPLHGH